MFTYITLISFVVVVLSLPYDQNTFRRSNFNSSETDSDFRASIGPLGLSSSLGRPFGSPSGSSFGFPSGSLGTSSGPLGLQNAFGSSNLPLGYSNNFGSSNVPLGFSNNFGSPNFSNGPFSSTSGAFGYPSGSSGNSFGTLGSPFAFGSTISPLGTSSNFGSPNLPGEPFSSSNGTVENPSGTLGSSIGNIGPFGPLGKPFGPSIETLGISNAFGSPNLSNRHFGYPIVNPSGAFGPSINNLGPFNPQGQTFGTSTGSFGTSNNFGPPYFSNGLLGIPNGSLGYPSGTIGTLGPIRPFNSFGQTLGPFVGTQGISNTIGAPYFPNGQIGTFNGSLGYPSGTSLGIPGSINSFGQPFGSPVAPFSFPNTFGFTNYPNGPFISSNGSLGYPGASGTFPVSLGPSNSFGKPFGSSNLPLGVSNNFGSPNLPNGYFGSPTGTFGNNGGILGVPNFQGKLGSTSSVSSFGNNGFASRGPSPSIVRDDRDFTTKDGSYAFDYETSDGTVRKEQGIPIGPDGAVAMRGSYSFTFPNGSRGQVSYIADENGFRVVSPLYPTTPAHAIAQLDKAKKEHEKALRTGNPLISGPFSKRAHPGLEESRGSKPESTTKQ